MGQTGLDGIRATMVLADHAQVADGKLNLIGGGWSFCGPKVAPFAIGLIIEVPWHLANEEHDFRLELIDRDGNPVVAPPNDGRPVALEGDFEVGRPRGIPVGTPLPVAFALNFSPAPQLRLGSRFEWRLSINGETNQDWRLGFSTRPPTESEAH